MQVMVVSGRQRIALAVLSDEILSRSKNLQK
jgi:hypothetical protein